MHKRIIVAVAMAWTLVTAAPVAAAPAVHESSTMWTLPAFAAVSDSSVSLTATANRATIVVSTTGLVPGNVYTLWAFTFSSPDNCVGGCGFDDAELRAEEVGFAVQHVAGHVSGQDGSLQLAGSIAVASAGGAEYHVVVAEHGALEPSDMPDAIKTPGPGAQIGFLG